MLVPRKTGRVSRCHHLISDLEEIALHARWIAAEPVVQRIETGRAKVRIVLPQAREESAVVVLPVVERVSHRGSDIFFQAETAQVNVVHALPVKRRPFSQTLAIIVAEKRSILIHDLSERVAPVPLIRLDRCDEARDVVRIHPIIVVEEEKIVTVYKVTGGR